ncbi:hypothetical protein P3T27_008095 [Kitasatospora sp. MAA19]|uniref:hypothetical protein n=1 Tax=unclassified Kitasatospora TaxID=2633591 RepID=UPI002476971D|nr:hypothetical protein [Kitasatospora sp. MAA19]MDH6711337.1 hypothetical protein [Kitasatospora sp. MAA19]
MIPYGVTPADDETAAKLFDMSTGYWRDTKRWTKIPGLKLLNRDSKRPRRVFSLEQLQAALAGEELPLIPTEPHPKDLLDLEEARLSIPAERRPTEKTMNTYRAPSSDTRLPDPVDVFGTEYWPRAVIEDWDEKRKPVGNPAGRPVGVVETKPRATSYPKAEQRRALVRELLTQHGAELTPDTVWNALQDANLGVTELYAERLLREARKAAAES